MTINNDQRHHDRISAGIHRLRGITHLARRSGAMAADRARYRPQPWPYMRGAARFLYRNLVLALDEKFILKIFPPFLRGQFASERSTLAQLRGRLRVAIPETIVEGERDGWPYLVITRLSGVLGAAAWPSLPEGDKERVLAEIGETIAEVQRIPARPLAQIEPSWDAFMRGQLQGG